MPERGTSFLGLKRGLGGGSIDVLIAFWTVVYQTLAVHSCGLLSPSGWVAVDDATSLNQTTAPGSFGAVLFNGACGFSVDE